MSHTLSWLDTTDVIWLDTIDTLWTTRDILSASLELDSFDDLFFDNVVDVTPSDSTIIKAGYIFVGSTGQVKVRMAQNNVDVAFNVLTAGSWIKFRVNRVYSSGTGATDIVLAN